MLFFPFIFLFIGLISGAGALLSFRAYRRAKIAAFKTRYSRLLSSPPNSNTDIPDGLETDIREATEEDIKRRDEREKKLEAKLEVAETTIADLKTAAELAPEPKGCGNHKKPAKKRSKNQNVKGSVK